MSVQRRLNMGFAALFLLFVTFLGVQFGVGSRLSTGHHERVARIHAAQIANEQVLQRMTDAETGIRGFQLTGDPTFLDPYESGRNAAVAALDEVSGNVDDEAIRALVDRERDIVLSWLREYAASAVAGGRPAREVRAIRGKQMFDELRLVNEAVGAAIEAEAAAEERADTAGTRLLAIGLGALGLAILTLGYAVVRTCRRHLLTPLESLGRTIRRQAAGDRTARAEPVGATELRPVVEALNDLAAQTEALLAAEQARAAQAGLRQAVAAQLRDLGNPPAAARRIAELVAAALGADAVHCEMAVPGEDAVLVRWPVTAPALPAGVAAELSTGEPGRPVIHAGGCGVPVGGGAGFLWVTRAGVPDWTGEEQRLLTGVAGEIERKQRQLTFQRHQERLISELRGLDQRKDVFIQTVTHELRTPLTSILGYTEMLLEEAGEDSAPMRKRALTAIMRNARRLQETIGDLVLLDRPDVGTAAPTEPVDLADLATTVHSELSNAARAKELEVSLAAVQSWVLGDRTQLQRALRKLLENAIKFTPSGGSVTCELSADARTVSVAVTDTGIGIPGEDVAGLFTPFHRAGNAMEQAVQGPGLGLAIVRDIVSDHGGSIAVQSVVGRGSTFTLTLPAVPAPVQVPAHAGA